MTRFYDDRTGLQFCSYSAIAFAAAAGRCVHNSSILSLIPLQFSLLSLAISLGVSRAEYVQFLKIGRLLSKLSLAVSFAPLVSSESWIKIEKTNFEPLIISLGFDPAARLSILQVFGISSILGYAAFVEIARLILSPREGQLKEKNDKTNYLRKILLERENWHNMGLTLLSFAMFYGIVHSVIISSKLASTWDLLCKPFQEDIVFLITTNCFFWSKFWEWIDTALLIAKGKPVSWLHYTHHGSTAILTMLNIVPRYNAMWSVVCATNSLVHTWMYGYYRFPTILRKTRRYLTQAQILQHACVLASVLYVLRQTTNACRGDECGRVCFNSIAPIMSGLLLYVMYLIFFVSFYFKTYIHEQIKHPPLRAKAE